MIEFIQNDTNLPAIRRESKLFNLVTRYKYRIYGLRQRDNPAVLVEYHYDKVDEHFEERLTAIKDFLLSNGIEVETYREADTSRVDVGMRKDLRLFVNKNKKPMLASAILQTIIYTLEGRTDLEQLRRYKLATIVKLVDPAAAVPQPAAPQQPNA